MQAVPQHVNMQSYDLKDQGIPAPPYTYPRSAPGFPTRQPRDYVLWSLFSFAFLNTCCLGFIALVFSFKSRDRKVVGDIEAATSYGNTAKSLNIAALVLSIVFIIIIIILFASGVVAMQQMYQSNQEARLSFEDYVQRSGK